nr:uncharacterized protein LOC128701919 [Cherax quadricarinatus]
MDTTLLLVIVALSFLTLLTPSTSDQKGAEWSSSNNYLELGPPGRKVDGERFVTQNNSVVTGQVGASVILHCKTSSATGGQVSWVRKRDYQLLTVGINSHSSDDRFSMNYVHWVSQSY